MSPRPGSRTEKQLPRIRPTGKECLFCPARKGSPSSAPATRHGKDEDERHIPAAQLFSLRFFTTATFFAPADRTPDILRPLSANRPRSRLSKSPNRPQRPGAGGRGLVAASAQKPDATGPSVFLRRSGPETGPRRYGCRNRRGRCPAPVPHNRPGAPPGMPRHRTSCR